MSRRARDADMDRIAALQAHRLRVHRLDPPRAIRDARRAAEFVRERGLVLSTGRSSLPMLAEAIAGRPLRGSWMAHPEVYRIHAILRRLTRYDIPTAPLILGRETLMDPGLAPAVERVASDPGRRRLATETLPSLGRRLLVDVEAQGQVRMDQWRAPTAPGRRARLLLERHLLVRTRSVHTETGYHTAMVVPWTASEFSRRFAAPARKIGLESALETLLLAAIRSAVIAPEREARRWFAFDGDTLERLLRIGKVDRLRHGGIIWVTPTASSSSRAERLRWKSPRGIAR